MPHWLIKSGIHRVISWLPASHVWNEVFQKYVTRSMGLGRPWFEVSLEDCRAHFQHLRDTRAGGVEGFKVLELGTGWYPVIPLGLYLYGASDIWTFDIAPLL